MAVIGEFFLACVDLLSTCAQIISNQKFHDSILGRIIAFAGDTRQLSRARTSHHRPRTARLAGEDADVLDDKAALLAIQRAGNALKAGEMSSIGSGAHQVFDHTLAHNGPS